jgi:hypothetical protein
MVSRVLSVGFVLCALSWAMPAAHAQCGNQWGSWYGGYAPTYYSYAPAWGGWQQSMTYQPAPSYAVPPAPAQAGTAAQPNGQIAQSNGQTYQSFSAEGAPANSYGSTATYPVQAYPTYNGYYGGSGYYGSPNYGGYGYSSNWRSLDNARYHGVDPNAYP